MARVCSPHILKLVALLCPEQDIECGCTLASDGEPVIRAASGRVEPILTPGQVGAGAPAKPQSVSSSSTKNQRMLMMTARRVSTKLFFSGWNAREKYWICTQVIGKHRSAARQMLAER
jgi:hypothetical protein